MDRDTYNHLILILLWATAPAATLFPLIYGLASPWWRSLIGRALLVKATAVMLLIDFSLLIRWVSLDPRTYMSLSLVITVGICLGVNMQCAALILEKIRRTAGFPR